MWERAQIESVAKKDLLSKVYAWHCQGVTLGVGSFEVWEIGEGCDKLPPQRERDMYVYG